jgi:hypothetical protein
MDALEGQMSHLESLGDDLTLLGDQMADENFNQAVSTLALIQDDIDALNLPTYLGTDPSLTTTDDQLQNAVDQTELLLAILEPVLQKAAENDAYIATQEDLAALASAEEITTKIDMYMSAASEALDTYSAE